MKPSQHTANAGFGPANAMATSPSSTRRQWLSQTAAATVGGVLAMGATEAAAQAAAPAAAATGAKPWKFCLNTSCIRGQELSLVEEIAIASQAGYSGIEPWIREIEAYQQGGGQLPDLRKRIEDAGLAVESAIGFARWAVDDPQERAQGLEQAKRDMDLVRALGGKRIAAPPVGVTGQKTSLTDLAARYRALLELGAAMEVTPQLEVWGHSQSLGHLAETVYVAVAAGHANACFLPDVYHLYKGGSAFEGLSLLSGSSIPCFHMNDYPAMPARDAIADADRVYPGDGVAPIGQILRTLREIGFMGVLSLELFNRTYWQQDPLEVAQTGLRKMQAAVAAAEV